MNRCQNCGNKFKLDLLIPDELWEQIKPEGRLKGAGLLCPACIVIRIERIYGYSAMQASFISSKQGVIKLVCDYCDGAGEFQTNIGKIICNKCKGTGKQTVL